MRYLPASVTEHDGSARARTDRFFGVPDASVIGELRSASTSLGARAPKRPWGWMIIGFLLFGGVSLALLTMITEDWGLPSWVVTVIANVGSALAVAWAIGPERVCSYVGTQGFVIATKPFNLFVRTRVLRFDDAWDVSWKWTRMYERGGAYRGTWIVYTWIDDEDRTVFTLEAGVHERDISTTRTDVGSLSALPPWQLAVAGRAAMLAFEAFVEKENAEDEVATS